MSATEPPEPRNPTPGLSKRRYWLWGGIVSAFVVPMLLFGALAFVKASGITNEVSFMIPMVSIVAPFGVMFGNFTMWLLSYYYRFPPELGNLTFVGLNLVGWFGAGALVGHFYGRIKASRLASSLKFGCMLLVILGVYALTKVGWSVSWKVPYLNDGPPYRRSDVRSQLKGDDDPAVCERSSGRRRDACYFQLALLKNDSNLCGRLPTGGFLANQRTCYSKLAFRGRDAAICRNIASSEEMEKCIADVAVARDDASLCDGLSVSGKVVCYTNLSLLKKKDYCQHITDNPSERERCYSNTNGRSQRFLEELLQKRITRTMLNNYDE